MAAEEPARSGDSFAPALERNTAALVERRRAERRRSTRGDRLAAVISGFAGSRNSVYIHLLVFGCWIVINLGWTPVPPFDPLLSSSW